MLHKIVRYVLSIHGLILMAVLFPITSGKPKHKPLIVRTVTVQQPTLLATNASPQPFAPPPMTRQPPQPEKKKSPPAKKKPTPEKKTTPPAAKPGPPPAGRHTPKPPPVKPGPPAQPPTPKPAPKKAPSPPAVDQKALSKLQKALDESIQKMDQLASPPAKTAPLPPMTFYVDQVPSEIADDYTGLLMATLHQSLSLPEFGEVKIQLTLHQDGHVVKLVIVHAENQINRDYLEKMLPHVSFPSFNGSLKQQKESTFILTFCNE